MVRMADTAHRRLGISNAGRSPEEHLAYTQQEVLISERISCKEVDSDSDIDILCET